MQQITRSRSRSRARARAREYLKRLKDKESSPPPPRFKAESRVYAFGEELRRSVGCHFGTSMGLEALEAACGSYAACEAYHKHYASLVLDKYTTGENLELVDAGPMVVVRYMPSNALLVHLNFKAKTKDKPNAVVKTFFSELIITSTEDVKDFLVRCLGRSNELPEKAETFGCLYCSHKNIHHPSERFSSCHHTGREGLFDFWRSKVKELSKCVQECEQSGKSPWFPDRGVVCLSSDFTNEQSGKSPWFPICRVVSDFDSPSQYAAAALRLFNSTWDQKWEFVSHRSSGHSPLPNLGTIVHINFNAKNSDDPEAEECAFFAEVICLTFLVATCCQLLCSSALLPEKAEHHGCCYCLCDVHHPPGLLYMNGRVSIRTRPLR